MNARGITLIEVLVVISIAAILFTALGFSFIGWEGQYSIESQIKVLYDDLMEARAQAMQRNRARFVTVASKGYTVYEDTSPAPDGNGTLETGSDTEILDEDLKETMELDWNGDAEIEFTQRGMSNDNKTLCIFSDVDPDYDCIVISATRINLGKIATQASGGGTCVSTNCDVK